ncbi:MAG: peptidylprolyl isomerase [Crocinitomicaceae bacterium]
MLRYVSLFILLSASSMSFSQKKVIDKIIARASDKIIMLSDIQAQKLQALKENIQITNESDCYILEEMLVQKLMLAKAEIDSIYAPEEQVEQELITRVNRIMQMFPGGKDEMEKFYGMSTAQIKDKFRVQISDMMTSQQMEATITENVSVTPKEIEDFYTAVPLDSLPLINSHVTLSQIIVFPEISEEDKAYAREKLNGIRKKIVDGDLSFAAAAALSSEDPGSAKNGGDLGWATRGTMVPEFEEVVFTLGEGEVSEVFESSFGFHILELIERRGDDYHCRHILITAQVSDYEFIKLNKKMNEAYQRIQKGEITFEEAIEEYSNDSDNKATKGSLMNPYTGDVKWDVQDLNQMDPEMSILVDQLKLGEISRPSQYMDMIQRKPGIRIIRLDDRTKPHRANLRDDYKMVQDATLNEKKQKEIDAWITENIKNIYIYVDEDYKGCPFKYDWFKTLE